MTGGVVRDLTIVYDTDGNPSDPHTAVAVNPSGEFRFGGIAGTATGNAQFINVLVKGAVTVGGSGSTAYVGGLIGQMTGTASIRNAYGGLNLTVNTNPGAGNSLYVGGIAGSMGRLGIGDGVTVSEASAVGNITVGGSGAVDTGDVLASENFVGLFVGGIAGHIRGASATAKAALRDADYREGTITVNHGAGSLSIGGVVGIVSGYSDVTECAARQKDLVVNKTGSGNSIIMGGFLGFFHWSAVDGNVAYCYAEGPVEITTNADIGAELGGFGGYIAADISNCYAAGTVRASGVTWVAAGGFASALDNPMTNCYALGDVILEARDSITAGGLVSYNYSTIDRCFAAGSVIGNIDTNLIVYAGGLIGRNYGGITNSASLGASVTATSPTLRYVGRIYGQTTGAGTISNNRAFDGMRLYSDTYANRDNPAPLAVTGGTHSGKDGMPATGDDFRRRDIWQNAASTAPTTFHGMGFNSAGSYTGTTPPWDFNSVDLRGRPSLKGANGAVMGGQ